MDALERIRCPSVVSRKCVGEEPWQVAFPVENRLTICGAAINVEAVAVVYLYELRSKEAKMNEKAKDRESREVEESE